MKEAIKGVLTALVTPFKGNKLEVDEEGLETLIERQIEKGITGLVVLGTTGESHALTAEERLQIISIAVEVNRKRVPLFIGTGSSSTQETIENSLQAQELGADGLLVVAPPYNTPPQKGIYAHFARLSEEVDLPILVYNIPKRTGVNIEPKTLFAIAKFPNIIGVKECNVLQIEKILHWRDLENPSFRLLSGDDASFVSTVQKGGDGVVSVLANLLPEELLYLYKKVEKKDFPAALQADQALDPFYSLLSLAPNPIAIKKAMDILSLPAGNCRLPLFPLDKEEIAKVHHLLTQGQTILEEIFNTSTML